MAQKLHPEAPEEKLLSSGSSTESELEFNLHSCYYRDFFLLRTPISINGHPAFIQQVSINDPAMFFSQQWLPQADNISSGKGLGTPIKLSAISLKVIGPVVFKHGIYHIESFYHDCKQEFVYSVSFRSESSLRKFLNSREAVREKLKLAIFEFVHLATQSSSLPQSNSMNDIDVGVELYLVSPSSSGKKKQPKVVQVSLTNYSKLAKTWQESKQFDFNSAMFRDPSYPTKLDNSNGELALSNVFITLIN